MTGVNVGLRMTYSRRKRLREREGQTLPFRSTPFTSKLLTQLLQIIDKMDGIFEYDSKLSSTLYRHVSEELGQNVISTGRTATEQFGLWFANEPVYSSETEHDLRLDCIEIACQHALLKGINLDRSDQWSHGERTRRARGWIEEVNERMMEDGFGFQYKDGQIIEFTSEFSYTEVVVPALGLLSNSIFAGANAEFRDAFEEFKSRNYEDSIADCGNALESVIKVIAANRGWDDVRATDPASKLIDAVFRHELVPSYMQDQLKGLRMMLQGGPTIRNKEAAHGAGENEREIARHLAAYQLHQTAAAIVFLVEQAGLT